jgi:N-acetylglucosaminyldiphosphoundecaprenol N-acetyl-beta-D-mannosaminyltransferase
LGETEKEVILAKEFIEGEFPRTIICGMFTLEHCGGDEDAIINDINAEATDVIISVLSSPRQEYFLANHKDKLSAKLWYGVGEGKFIKPRHGIANAFIKLFRVKKLMKYIKRYEKQKET